MDACGPQRTMDLCIRIQTSKFAKWQAVIPIGVAVLVGALQAAAIVQFNEEVVPKLAFGSAVAANRVVGAVRHGRKQAPTT